MTKRTQEQLGKELTQMLGPGNMVTRAKLIELRDSIDNFLKRNHAGGSSSAEFSVELGKGSASTTDVLSIVLRKLAGKVFDLELDGETSYRQYAVSVAYQHLVDAVKGAILHNEAVRAKESKEV